MTSGRFTLRGIIQRLTDGVGARGGLTTTWAQFAKRWMEEVPLGGTERFQSGQEQAFRLTRFRCQRAAGINPKMRVLAPKVGASTKLVGSINASATTVVVASATVFPQGKNFRVRIGSELLEVTAGQSTTSWTATRGVDGTTATPHGDGAGVRHMIVYDIESISPADNRDRLIDITVKEAA